MDRQTYRAALERLTGADVNRNVGPTSLVEVCPHLTQEELAGIVSMVKRTGKHFDWAAPPLLVKEGYLVLRLFPPKPPARGSGQPAQLGLSFNGVRRTPTSYAQISSIPRQVIRMAGNPLPYAVQAMDYANRHWPDDLILDDWLGFGVVELRHPRMANAQGYPTRVRQVEFCLTRSWGELEDDTTARRSALIEASLCHPTVWLCEGAELQGHHRVRQVCNCSLCGAALWSGQGSDTGECLGCGATFKSSADFQIGWKTPLPPTLAAMFVDSGHKFEIDPAIALEFEEFA